VLSYLGTNGCYPTARLLNWSIFYVAASLQSSASRHLRAALIVFGSPWVGPLGSWAINFCSSGAIFLVGSSPRINFRVRLNALRQFTKCTPFWSGQLSTPIFLEWTIGHSNIFGVDSFPLQNNQIPWCAQFCTPLILECANSAHQKTIWFSFSWSAEKYTPLFMEWAQNTHQNIGVKRVCTPLPKDLEWMEYTSPSRSKSSQELRDS
jgi:hypothetical protein